MEIHPGGNRHRLKSVVRDAAWQATKTLLGLQHGDYLLHGFLGAFLAGLIVG